MENSDCNHQVITLIKANKQKRFKCKHCHLTISFQELGNSYCPECFETRGKKHYDFEEINEPEIEKTRYRCESCGLIIKC